MAKVIFSGENPGLTLYKPGTEQVVAAASYWRCVYSEHGFGSMEPTHARFFQESDSRWYHRVVANPGSNVIELVWWDVAEYQMVNRTDYQLGPSTWDLATVICPCKSAEIRVSNQPVAGEVRFTSEGQQASSSSFLAFSETWVEK